MAARKPRSGARGRQASRRAGKKSEAPPAVAVGALLEEGAEHLKLRLLAGRSGLDHQILQSRVQRPGLALTGHTDYIRYGRVQIVGQSEIGYLRKLQARERSKILEALCACEISCFVVTRGLTVSRELQETAERRDIPLLTTPIASTPFIKSLTSFLDQHLAPSVSLHSVLVDVFGLGVLLVGESGIGKSECALDLVDRGHGLVADDVTEVRRIGGALIGRSHELTRDHMELRGIGLINIRDLYGVSAIRLEKRLELVVQLERWERGREYDRLGLDLERYPILGVELPLIRMPVAPGRHLAILIEVAARNRLLKERGFDAARELTTRVDAEVAAGGPQRPPPRERR